jgi:hypothetical protein
MPWQLATAEPSLFREFRTWIQRKTTDPVLHYGNTELRYREDSECYVIRRYIETAEAVLLINFSQDRQALDNVMKRFDLIGTYTLDHSQDTGNLPDFIGPGETMLFQKRN